MKKSLIRILAIIFIILTIGLIAVFLLFYNPVDLKQAQRIAKWKSDYDKIVYDFDLVNLHEEGLISNSDEINEEVIYEIIKPYFNLESSSYFYPKKYSYVKMNGRHIKKDNQFYFDKFLQTKSGSLISFKKNMSAYKNEKSPVYYMFIDVNGVKKPNRIGKDIFFVNVYKNHISPLGDGRSSANLKISCSPIGNGLYCSESYLLGGHI